MKEVWKWLNNFNNIYQISDQGKIRSYYSNNRKQITRKYKLKKLYLNKDGYLVVSLYKDGKIKLNKAVHRLVMETFVKKSKLEVNHKNGIKIDNRLCNLEYCTRLQNEKHAWKIGLKNKYQSPLMKKVKQYDLKDNLINKFLSISEASRKTNIGIDSISGCVNKKYKTGGGYIWRFENEMY